MNVIRIDGRASLDVRPITVIYGLVGNAHGSALFKIGNTQVLCSVIVQQGVPHFLRGKGTGWLTAEYAMLPGATSPRTTRESIQGKRDGRSVEISRLIGRSLRSVVDLAVLGERTLYIDCDVIQADGGTRSAAITGAYCALRHALQNKDIVDVIDTNILIDSIGALSVGIFKDELLLDLNYQEDSMIDADFNFVMTGSGKIIEVQGATESRPLSWNSVQLMHDVVAEGIQNMLSTL